MVMLRRQKGTDQLAMDIATLPPSPSPSPCIPLPEHIKTILVTALTERGTGKDWEHFTLGLGFDRAEKENIKLRQGDVDRLERNNCDDTRKLLRNVKTLATQKKLFLLGFLIFSKNKLL